jgi:nitrite reductase/ring-hydroxylating ferredoxin subunit
LRKVAWLDSVPPGESRLFVIGPDRAVVLVNQGDRVYALDGICPHQGFALEGASLEGNCLLCPHHNYGFDIRTGENTYPGGKTGLRTYTVEIRDREIWAGIYI